MSLEGEASVSCCNLFHHVKCKVFIILVKYLFVIPVNLRFKELKFRKFQFKWGKIKNFSFFFSNRNYNSSNERNEGDNIV